MLHAAARVPTCAEGGFSETTLACTGQCTGQLPDHLKAIGGVFISKVQCWAMQISWWRAWMLRQPLSAVSCLMVRPPLPMTRPIWSVGTLMRWMWGAPVASSPLGAGLHDSMRSSTVARALAAAASAWGTTLSGMPATCTQLDVSAEQQLPALEAPR